MPDCSAVRLPVSSEIGPISWNAYSRNAIRVETSIRPLPARQAPIPRIAIMASWMPVHEMLHTTAEVVAALTPCRAASSA